MVNSNGEGQVNQSLLSTSTEFYTLNQSQLKELSTSGLCQPSSSVKESIRRRLTARVIPMTRNKTSHIENTEEEFSGNLQKGLSSKGSLVVQPCSEESEIRGRRTESVIKIEKKEAPVCQRSNELHNANFGKHRLYGESNLEPQPKQNRTSPPSNLLTPQESSQQMRRLRPNISEPKLLGDNVATLSLLTASQGHLATLQDEDGDTPVHIAIAQCHLQLVQYLTQIASTSGISLDIYNNMKQTPLHLAVITNQPLVIRCLISAGVDINMPDRNGQTSIHLACQRSSVECLMELVNARQPVHLEAKNFNGYTPLHEAVMSNSPEVIKFLVAYGANVDSKDGKSGRTPLHYAVELEFIPVIQLLINSGANVSAASFSGNTPIQTASGRGLHHITKLLLGNTLDASGRDTKNDSSKYKIKSTSWK